MDELCYQTTDYFTRCREEPFQSKFKHNRNTQPVNLLLIPRLVWTGNGILREKSNTPKPLLIKVYDDASSP